MLPPRTILHSREVVSGLSSRPARLREPGQRSSSSPATLIIPRVIHSRTVLLLLSVSAYNACMRVREAKDFLVQEISAEAQAEGTPLSDLERRMLYFTESDDAIEDPVALNEQFTAQYDTGEYEKKISLLMSHAYRRIKRESPEKLRLWNDAFRVLGKGDHYILLFWKQPKSNKSWQNGTIYVLAGLAAIGLYLLLFFLFGSRRNLRHGERAPIEKFIPAVSPPVQHILQFLFLLLLFLAIFPKFFSKFVNLCWPRPGSNSPGKRPE